MTKIIKFPTLRFCDDCAQPLEANDGKVCNTDGCDNVVCDFCREVSAHCVKHMKERIAASRS